MDQHLLHRQLLAAQRSEISEYHTYHWLAARTRDEANRNVLERIAADERRHYEVLKAVTGRDVPPHAGRVWRYQLIARLLGLSFGLRLMERGEKMAGTVYGELKREMPQLAEAFRDEQSHEAQLLGLISEQRIEYAGSVVLGLNDALVELTGALAGLTLALQNTRLIAMTGFITGIAASMSMASSGFLAAREEADQESGKSPAKAAAYTGVAYVVTVLILITPYLLLDNVYICLGLMLASSILIILAYNFYITTAKSLPLWRRFGEMAGLSLGVAVISFFVGMAARVLFGAGA